MLYVLYFYLMRDFAEATFGHLYDNNVLPQRKKNPVSLLEIPFKKQHWSSSDLRDGPCRFTKPVVIVFFYTLPLFSVFFF